MTALYWEFNDHLDEVIFIKQFKIIYKLIHQFICNNS